MKKFSWLCLCLIFVLSACCLAACGNNNNDIETEAQMKTKVDAAMTAVNLDVNVTENIDLPSTIGDVAVSWSSNKSALISNTGTVVRPLFGENDAEVKLTGSFSYKDYSDTKVFTITVKAIREKVFTFANGHTGDDAVFTAPSDLSFGSVIDKGEGVITLKPNNEEEGIKNGPYFDISNHIPEWKGNGFTAKVMVYLDREEMADDESSFAIDFSLSGTDEAELGSVSLNFSADDTNARIFHSQTLDNETDSFMTATGWYTVGINFHEKNGKLNAKITIEDTLGTELKSWTVGKFLGFNVEDSTGEQEDVDVSLAAAPRSILFTNMNINGVDVKKVTLSYNSL